VVPIACETLRRGRFHVGKNYEPEHFELAGITADSKKIIYDYWPVKRGWWTYKKFGSSAPKQKGPFVKGFVLPLKGNESVEILEQTS
jgi:hypothetical protein